MTEPSLIPVKLTISDIVQAVGGGWRLFLGTAWPCIAYSSIAVCSGFMLLLGAVALGLSPMALPLAGGFMLVAPAMLTGYFHMVIVDESGGKVRLSTPFIGFMHAPLQIWVIAVFCAFLFLIWLTDAGVLYSFTLEGNNREAAWLWFATVDRSLASFWLWGSLMGGFLAFVIFVVSAFSVPLLFERRANLVQAVTASVRAVFLNFLHATVWGVVLSLLIVTSVLLLPLLLVLLPVLAYASFLLYRSVFPIQ